MSHRGTKALKENQEKDRVRREKKNKEKQEKQPEPLYHTDDDDNVLFKANYADSMYGMRMLLLRDGRRRGLWVWLEEEVYTRLNSDKRRFDQGMDKFLPELEKIFAKKDKENRMFEVRQALRFHLSLFFDNRTQGTAVRLTWPQVRELAAQLKAGDKDEKEKTEC